MIPKQKTLKPFQVIRSIDVVFNVSAIDENEAIQKCRIAGLSNRVQVTENLVLVEGSQGLPWLPFKPSKIKEKVDPYEIMEFYFNENSDFDDYANLLAKVANGAIGPEELRQKFIKAKSRNIS
jgi:hypothetical protein